MCAEAFSNFLIQVENQRLIHGLKFGNNITISHQLFVDDNLNENHQGTIKTSSDPLHIHGGPITKARAKNMQAALNGLIEKIWIENEIQDARHYKLGLKGRQGIVGIIQVIGQPNTQVVSNAERSNSK